VIGISDEDGAAVPGAPRAGADELLQALEVPLAPELLERALTHRSFAYENGGLPTNERLEFLGDSVLGLIVTDTLFREYPDLPEGQLAKLRAAVVNMRALAGVARGLQLGAYVRLGKGEEGTGGRDKSSILADTLEAVLGAVYIDRGLAEADALVHRLFDPVIARSARLGAGLDWKTSLQELTAAEVLGVPEYHVDESGPDHQKSFHASVRIGGQTYGQGEGRSKKEAEQQAAEAAWTAITEGISAAAAAKAGPDGSGATEANAAGGNAGATSAGNTDARTANAGTANPGTANAGTTGAGTTGDGTTGAGTTGAANAGPGGAGPANAGPGGARPANAGPGGARPAKAGPGGAGPTTAGAAGNGAADRAASGDAATRAMGGHGPQRS
jgi:ribonuclease-3